jgi:hypothetical protein
MVLACCTKSPKIELYADASTYFSVPRKLER